MVALPKWVGVVRKPSIVGIGVGASGWEAAHVRRENGACLTLASVPLGGAAEDPIANPEAFGRRLAEALSRAGIREKRCAVRIPCSWAMTFAVDVPDVSEADLRGFLALRAEKELLLPPAEVTVAPSVWRLPGLGGRRALVAVPAAGRMGALDRMLEAAGRHAVSVALELDSRMFPAGGDGAGGVDVLALASGVAIVLRVGGAVAALLPVAAPEDGGAGDAALAKVLGRELRLLLGQQPAEVRAVATRVRLVGRRVASELVSEALAAALAPLGVSVERVTAGEAGGVPDTPVAAAEDALLGRAALFEFVPPPAPKHVAWGRYLQSRLVRRATAAAGVLLGLGVLALGVRSCQESRLARIEAEHEPAVRELIEIQEQIRKYRPWFDDTPGSVMMLERLVAAFPSEGRVWARKLELHENGRVACGGLARSNADFMAVLERLRKTPGVADLQVQQVRGTSPAQVTFDFRWEGEHERRR